MKMARFLTVFVLTLAIVCVSQAEDESLWEKVRELLSDKVVDKRAFYNVWRNKDRVRVYFQTTSTCKRCAHTVRYWADGVARKTSTKPGTMEVDLPDTYIDRDVMIQVCEDSLKNCRYAFLPEYKEGARFSTLSENGL